MHRLRVTLTDRRNKLGQRHAERVRDPVECVDFGRYPAGLDLDDRLPMHAGQLREQVDRYALLASKTGDANAKGTKIGDGSGHPINVGAGALIAQ